MRRMIMFRVEMKNTRRGRREGDEKGARMNRAERDAKRESKGLRKRKGRGGTEEGRGRIRAAQVGA